MRKVGVGVAVVGTAVVGGGARVVVVDGGAKVVVAGCEGDAVVTIGGVTVVVVVVLVFVLVFVLLLFGCRGGPLFAAITEKTMLLATTTANMKAPKSFVLVGKSTKMDSQF